MSTAAMNAVCDVSLIATVPVSAADSTTLISASSLNPMMEVSVPVMATGANSVDSTTVRPEVSLAVTCTAMVRDSVTARLAVSVRVDDLATVRDSDTARLAVSVADRFLAVSVDSTMAMAAVSVLAMFLTMLMDSAMARDTFSVPALPSAMLKDEDSDEARVAVSLPLFAATPVMVLSVVSTMETELLSVAVMPLTTAAVSVIAILAVSVVGICLFAADVSATATLDVSVRLNVSAGCEASAIANELVSVADSVLLITSDVDSAMLRPEVSVRVELLAKETLSETLTLPVSVYDPKRAIDCASVMATDATSLALTDVTI